MPEETGKAAMKSIAAFQGLLGQQSRRLLARIGKTGCSPLIDPVLAEFPPVRLFKM
jgi:hypothetical protein